MKVCAWVLRVVRQSSSEREWLTLKSETAHIKLAVLERERRPLVMYFTSGNLLLLHNGVLSFTMSAIEDLYLRSRMVGVNSCS